MRGGVVRRRLVFVLVWLFGLSARGRLVRTAFQSGLLRRDQRSRVDRSFRCSRIRVGLPGHHSLPAFPLGFVLRPNRVEFHLDHARGYREIVTLREFVKKGSLHPLTRHRIVVALHALPHLLAELGKIFQPDRFRERVVDRRRQALLHLLHLDIECRVLAGEIGGAVIGREGHLDGALLARFGPGQLVLKSRDEPSRAELDRDILTLAARKFHVANLADKVDDDQVTALGRAIDRLRFALRLGQPFDRAVEILLGHFGYQPLDTETGEIGLRHVGQELDRHLVFEIGAFGG